MGITTQNALSIVEQYDIVVDCTDAPSTRYLISDTAVVRSKPLISGSALGTEGQITVYGYKGGPCYRCVFPNPPPAESVTTCGEGGVLGPGSSLHKSLLISSCRSYWSNASARNDQGYSPFRSVFGSSRNICLSSKYDHICSFRYSSMANVQTSTEKCELYRLW